MTPNDAELPADQSRVIAVRIREELARRRISREQAAHEARISLSTLEKALAGRRPFTLATLLRLEAALGSRSAPRPPRRPPRPRPSHPSISGPTRGPLSPGWRGAI
jgi:hypothetical protein